MNDASNPSAPRRRLLHSPARAAAIVYVVAATALWLWYPHSPRLVIDAGPAGEFAGQFVGFTPDGQSILTFKPNLVQFWNAQSGRLGLSIAADKQTWKQPAVEFSNDGKRLTIGGILPATEGQFYSLGRDYYDAESGEKLSSVRFSGFVEGDRIAASESADGSMIASSGRDATLVHDTITGEFRFQVPGGTVGAFSADGKTLAVAARTDAGRWAVKFFDPVTGNEQRTFAEGDGSVGSIAISPQGDKLALAVWQDAQGPSETRGIQLWDIASERREQTLPMDRDDVANLGRLQFLADGRVISTVGFFRGFAWDHTVAAPDNLVGKTGLTPFPTVLSPDGRLAALLDVYGNKIGVRRLGNAKVEAVSQLDYANSYPVVMTADQRLIVSVNVAGSGLRGTMAKVFPGLASRYDVIDATNGKLLGSIPQAAGMGPAGVSPDGQTLVTTEFVSPRNGRFTLWNIPTATPWLAILGIAALPAAAVGWFVRERQRSRREPVVA